MDEKRALEELQFIRKVIDETRRSVIYNGKDYIFWGILVIIGMMSTYLFVINEIYFGYGYIWLILIPIGWGYSLYNGKKQKERFPSTFAGKLIGYVWGMAGIAMTIIGFVGTASGAVSPMGISPIACIIMGGAYFLTGKLCEAKWMSNLSYGWWIGGTALLFVKTVESFLIMSLLMLFLQTIPGIIIYRKYKKELASNS
ncbi:MAG: hypothetical protein GYA14_16055 [Ignavibacteria bacterium]|nr:hypothetical protein [Ignavibacteria bacterium]